VELVPDRVDVTDDHRHRTGDDQPLALDGRIAANQWQHESRQYADRNNRLADVECEHTSAEFPALGPERIRTSSVAATVLADVHALESPQQQAADE
jgi:hypothetical protein